MLRLIFAFLNTMRAGDGPPKYIHDEKKAMNEINFEFLQRSAALAYSKSKAHSLNFWREGEPTEWAIEDLIQKPYS